MNSFTNNHKVFFRLDCGGGIGYGHLSRCLALADEFSRNNVTPIFIIRKRPSIANLSIAFKIIWLREVEDVTSLDTNTWRVGTEEGESRETLPLLDKCSLVILDHYGLGYTWQKDIRINCHKLILFQDVFMPRYEADLVINYTIGSEVFYRPNAGNSYLLGPQYTPLSSEYIKMHSLRFSSETTVKNVGVYLGGIKAEYIKAVAAAMSLHSYFTDKEIEWVVNTGAEKEIIEDSFKDKNINVYIRLPNLVNLYKKVQLFIGTSGIASLERGCMGIWQLNFLVADNQNANVASMVNRKLGFFLGDIRKLSSDEIIKAFSDALSTREEEKVERIERLFNLIDGTGAYAIVQAIAKEGF